MKKFLIRFFLSLYIFLWGGYSLFFVGAYQGRIIFSAVELSAGRGKTAVQSNQHDQPFQVRATSSEKKQFLKIEATEIGEQEEDERESSPCRKQLKNLHSFLAVFSGGAFQHLLAGGKCVRPFYQDYSYTAFSRYLFLQVFRI